MQSLKRCNALDICVIVMKVLWEFVVEKHSSIIPLEHCKIVMQKITKLKIPRLEVLK